MRHVQREGLVLGASDESSEFSAMRIAAYFVGGVLLGSVLFYYVLVWAVERSLRGKGKRK